MTIPWISTYSQRTLVEIRRFTFDHFNSHDSQTPWKNTILIPMQKTSSSGFYSHISTFGPYCFLVTTSGAILNPPTITPVDFRFLHSPIGRSDHRLPLGLILRNLRAEAEISQLYTRHPTFTRIDATRRYVLTLPSVPKRMLSLLISR